MPVTWREMLQFDPPGGTYETTIRAALERG